MAMGIDCMGIWFMASTSWVWYRLHGHLVHGIGCMSIEDATHGIGIGCIGVWFRHQLHGCMGIMAMGIEYHQNRMPHMVSVSTAWVSVP